MLWSLPQMNVSNIEDKVVSTYMWDDNGGEGGYQNPYSVVTSMVG